MPQSLARIIAHIIFSTKNRQPLILPEFRDKLHAYMAGILKQIDSPAILINSVADHAHVLCRLSKNHARAWAWLRAPVGARGRGPGAAKDDPGARRNVRTLVSK